jgi:hypothetical protein
MKKKSKKLILAALIVEKRTKLVLPRRKKT